MNFSPGINLGTSDRTPPQLPPSVKLVKMPSGHLGHRKLGDNEVVYERATKCDVYIGTPTALINAQLIEPHLLPGRTHSNKNSLMIRSDDGWLEIDTKGPDHYTIYKSISEKEREDRNKEYEQWRELECQRYENARKAAEYRRQSEEQMLHEQRRNRRRQKYRSQGTLSFVENELLWAFRECKPEVQRTMLNTMMAMADKYPSETRPKLTARTSPKKGNKQKSEFTKAPLLRLVSDQEARH